MCVRTLFPTMIGGMTTGPDAWEALLRAHAALVPRIAADVLDATGLPLTWYDVLYELRDSPLRMQELGERVVLSRSRASRIVDELETAGLVARRPDSDDGRATLAELTPAGRRRFRRAAPAYVAAIERHFAAHLGPGEAAAIAAGLQRAARAQTTPAA